MDDPTPIEIRVDQEPGQPVRLTVAGADTDVPADADPTEVGFAVAAAEAQRRGQTVRAVLLDGRDALEWHVLVRPDGAVTDDLDAFETPPPHHRLPLRRGLLVALGAAVVLGGVAYAAARQTPIETGPSSSMPTTSVRAVEPTPGPSSSTAASPTSLASLSPLATASPAPTASSERARVAASPIEAARSSLRPRPIKATPTPARVARATVPVPPAAEAAPTVATPPAAAPVRVLADASGRCLTADLALASCDRSAAQNWTYSAGQLRHGGQCLTYGSGLGLAACDAARASGWTASAATTTNAGLCLEAVGARAALTQCGTGAELVLTDN